MGYRIVSLILAILFFASSAHAIAPAGPPYAGVGGTSAIGPNSAYGIPAGAVMIYLSCGSTPTTSGGNSSYPCRRYGVGYQITANKKLTCFAGTQWGDTAAIYYQWGTSTATVADNTASPTGAIYESGTVNTNAHDIRVAATLEPIAPTEFNKDATGLFPFINIVQASARVEVNLVCFEQ
jgi:hypothetical protein